MAASMIIFLNQNNRFCKQAMKEIKDENMSFSFTKSF